MYITKGNVTVITVPLYNTVYNRKHETVTPKEQLLFRLTGKNGLIKVKLFKIVKIVKIVNF